MPTFLRNFLGATRFCEPERNPNCAYRQRWLAIHQVNAAAGESQVEQQGASQDAHQVAPSDWCTNCEYVDIIKTRLDLVDLTYTL